MCVCVCFWGGGGVTYDTFRVFGIQSLESPRPNFFLNPVKFVSTVIGRLQLLPMEGEFPTRSPTQHHSNIIVTYHVWRTYVRCTYQKYGISLSLPLVYSLLLLCALFIIRRWAEFSLIDR